MQDRRNVMRLAVLSDVHADVASLRSALAQAARLGCTQIACNGDLVDYGRYPEATIALLAEQQVCCIRGNHDRWALERPVESGLSADALRWLAALETSWELTRDGTTVLGCHASPRSDMMGIDPSRDSGPELERLLEDGGVDVLVVGHTHQAFEILLPGGRRILNPGSTLTDADHLPRALDHGIGTFGVLELPSRRWTVHAVDDGREVEIVRTWRG